MHVCPTCGIECACEGDEGPEMQSEQWAEHHCVCDHAEFEEEFGFPLEEDDDNDIQDYG